MGGEEGSRRESGGRWKGGGGCSLIFSCLLATLKVNVQRGEGFQTNEEVHDASCIAVVGTVVELTQRASGVLKLLISVCV